MLKSHEISLKLSEKRQRLNELNFKDDKSETELNELDAVTKTVQGHEIEYRAAVTAEDAALSDAKELFNGDGEAAEIRQLRGRATFHNYVMAALERRSLVGAESEFNSALGIIEADRFPLIMLAGKEPEMRATSDTDTSVSPAPWLDRLLAETAAQYLGITYESVSPGIATFPVTSAGGSPAQRGRTEDAAVAAWTVDSTDLKPARNVVHLEYSKEDSLRIPMLQEALIRDMRMALIEAIDRIIFVGDDGANENQADISGLSTTTGVVEKTLTQTNKIKPDKTLQAFNSLVNGIHATDLGDLRIVVSEATYQLWTGHVLNVSGETSSVFKTLAQFLNDSRVMWQTRELESATTNGKFGAFISRSRGLTGAARMPMWNTAELIIDRYTKAKSGQCLVTLTSFWNFSLPRAANFARLKYVT